ncbi:MAG: hypothetical protein F6K09_19385 [Merismopedia sp. SIO2A8]|nr:hypothetical protein [Symploca sp. SIO2B6]NET50810.1 hypothetical protein [Merismopedia sp. SIO2A8]
MSEHRLDEILIDYPRSKWCKKNTSQWLGMTTSTLVGSASNGYDHFDGGTGGAIY